MTIFLKKKKKLINVFQPRLVQLNDEIANRDEKKTDRQKVKIRDCLQLATNALYLSGSLPPREKKRAREREREREPNEMNGPLSLALADCSRRLPAIRTRGAYTCRRVRTRPDSGKESERERLQKRREEEGNENRHFQQERIRLFCTEQKYKLFMNYEVTAAARRLFTFS